MGQKCANFSAKINLIDQPLGETLRCPDRLLDVDLAPGGSSLGVKCPELFPSQRDDDVAVLIAENNATVLDGFDLQLMGLAARLQRELLAFLHAFAVDDREVRALIHRDGSQKKGAQWDIRTDCAARVGGGGGWFKSDGPEWIAAIAVQLEGRFLSKIDRRTIFRR